VTRHLSVPWPDPAPFRERAAGTAIRLLAVSDVPDPALEHAENRQRLGPVDLVVGAGDLEPDYLGFLADAFVAPLAYVRGNHDAGAAWTAESTGPHGRLPHPLPDSRVRENAGLDFVGLSWPSLGVRGRAPEGAAWRQVLPLAVRALRNGRRPLIVVSHVPPRGAGDTPEDPFHRGFAAYRWIAEHLRPRLWLHGHTHPAAQTQPWQSRVAETTVINVTGAVLIELSPAAKG
jgi:hypothetical protein